MKFQYGMWQQRAGIQMATAKEVAEAESHKDNSMTALLTTRHVRHRGDTLNRPTITLKLHSPADGVIGAEAYHFGGERAREPHFELYPDGPINREFPVKVDVDNESTASLSAGPLKVSLCKTPDRFSLHYKGPDGKSITHLGDEALNYFVDTQATETLPVGPFETTAAKNFLYKPTNGFISRAYMSVSLGLGVGEHIYGSGERFTATPLNGQTLQLWAEDGGTSYDISYINVPFFLSSKGYGIFIDTTDYLEAEIGSENVHRTQFAVASQSIRWYIIYGPTPKEILDRYTRMLGRPALPPSWSYGLWLTSSFEPKYDEQTVSSFVDEMRRRSIPLSVFHFDCGWMADHHWTDFAWKSSEFPNPAGFLQRLHSRGLKTCCWINSYISGASKLFKEGHEKRYLIQTKQGDTYQTDRWQAGTAFVDFTNPEATKWYQSHLAKLLDQGVDAIKTDFGERMPIHDVVLHNGTDPKKTHNFYPHLYNKAVWNVLREKYGNNAVLFARSGTAGGQRMPVHWGGDCTSSFVSMAESLRGGLALGLSGYPFWAHDIGGFMKDLEGEEDISADVYKRWVQFGLLSSHSRLHGNTSYRVPWLVDDEASKVLEYYVKLKLRLMPYIYGKSIECTENGSPMVRAMLVEFPEDPTAWFLDQQYMLGDSLLVAPIFNGEGQATYYLPQGSWIGFDDGKTRQGPGWRTESFNYFNLPLLVRPGAAILLCKAAVNEPVYDTHQNTPTLVLNPYIGDQVKCHLTIGVPNLAEHGQRLGKVEVTVSGKKVNISTDIDGFPLSVRVLGDGNGWDGSTQITMEEKQISVTL